MHNTHAALGISDTTSRTAMSHAQADGFQVDEMEHLLRALFEDSEYRRDALARIRASAW